jgi:nuclear pore complex protein Nup98-Nup96
LGVYPIDRTTREEIIDTQRIKAMNYSDYLREVTKKFDGEFINYGVTDGSWTFMVQHFTRYGLDGSEDDFVVVKQPQPQQKVINPNFLDQTIALNDTYALSSPKSQPMDMEEKENTTSLHQQQNVRFTNQSLIGLRPNVVEQLAQSMFCDDDEDDFDGFPQPNGD